MSMSRRGFLRGLFATSAATVGVAAIAEPAKGSKIQGITNEEARRNKNRNDPPSPVMGELWNDTSNPWNPVLKCWNGDEWIRMDGGGDIPDNMKIFRYVSDRPKVKSV